MKNDKKPFSHLIDQIAEAYNKSLIASVSFVPIEMSGTQKAQVCITCFDTTPIDVICQLKDHIEATYECDVEMSSISTRLWLTPITDGVIPSSYFALDYVNDRKLAFERALNDLTNKKT